MQIFRISVTVAASDTFLMFSTIPFFIVPSAPTTTGITTVILCQVLCISSSRSLYFLFVAISFRAMFLSHETVISIILQVEFTESLTTMSGLFPIAVVVVLTGMSHMMLLFIMHYSLWLMLVPFICNIYIMSFTHSQMGICCRIILPGDVFCFS